MKQIDIPIPVDVVVAKECSATADAVTKPVGKVGADEMILDIGPETALQFANKVEAASTIVWNGPVGVFELEPFSDGTKSLALAIAKSSGFTIAGGGDTLAAIDKYDISEKISYISTGGGAFLEFLEGKPLPAITVLEKRYAETH